MISRWFTQLTTCWSFTTCDPASLPLDSTAKICQCSPPQEVDNKSEGSGVKGYGKKGSNEDYNVGKVLSTLTASTATSFSSWTRSFLSVRKSTSARDKEEDPIMVIRQPTDSQPYLSYPFKGSQKTTCFSSQQRADFVPNVARSLPKNQTENKNELLVPISPYEEIPTIRDLLEQLSPRSSSRWRQTRSAKPEGCQGGQDAMVAPDPRKCRSKQGHQAKAGVPKREGNKRRDDPHEVPYEIEIESYSMDDSDLSLEEDLRQYGDDQRDERSVRSSREKAPHAETPMSTGSLPVWRKMSVDTDKELGWPSDEESSPRQKLTIATKLASSTKKLRRRRRQRGPYKQY